MFERSFLSRWGVSGAAALPVVLVIGSVVLELTLVSSFVAYTLSQSGFGERASTEALFVARSGAMDAIRKVVRNKDFSDADGYTLTVGSKSASVTVTKDSPTTGQTRVVSTGTAWLRQKKIRADLTVNATTGEVNLISFEEIDL